MNIFDKSLKQKYFCYKNACEIKKAAISIQPEPELRLPLTLRFQSQKAPKHTPTLCRRLLIFLAGYSNMCRAQGLLPMTAQIWPAHLQLNSLARVSYSTHTCAQVFYRNRMRDIQARTVIPIAVHSTMCFTGVPPNINWILNNCLPKSPAANLNHIWQQRLPHSQLWYHLSGTKLGTGWGQMPAGPPRKTKRIQYFMDFFCACI